MTKALIKLLREQVKTKEELLEFKRTEIKQLRKQIEIISGADGTCYAALWDETEKRENAEKEIEQLRSENERLWSLCRNVFGSDRFVREALGGDPP